MWLHEIAGVVVPVVFIMFLTAVVVVPVYLKSKDRARLHETLRMAYERGQTVPPELIAALQSSGSPVPPLATPERDLRRAVILIGVGMGLCGLGYGLWYGLMSVSDVAAYIVGGCVAGAGAIPGLIGAAFLILWLGRRNAPQT